MGWSAHFTGGDLDAYKRAVGAIAAHARNPRDLYDEAGQIMKNSYVPQIFRAGGAIDGHEAWAPLKDPTRGGKDKAGGGRPLNDTGRMRDSVDYRVDATGVEIGTLLKSKDGFAYPGIHQTGGRRLPQREWLFWTQAVLEKIARRWQSMLLGAP